MIARPAFMVASIVLALTTVVFADPIQPGQIRVIDGDTIKTTEATYRLVGFDAPETHRAKCPSERELGNRATFRLRQLIAGDSSDLERIACSCRPGTEGTPACNRGRLCGVLRVRGEDVAAIMIREGLARPLVCGPTRCPRREGWCDGAPK